MERMNGKVHCKTSITIRVCSLICILAVIGGCSTASWIIHHNGAPDSLIITEADVDAMISELSKERPNDPETVRYNKATDRYELTSDAYGKAISDGIIRRIQDNRISTFLEDYRPEGFVDALKKDMGTSGAVILLLGILGSLFY